MSYELEQKIKALETLADELIILADISSEGKAEVVARFSRIRKSLQEELCKRKTGEEAAEDLERFVNCISMRAEKDKFADKVTNGTHRTLHQSIIGLMFKTILKTAETERYDGRNEASVMACRMIAPIIKGSHLPFI